MWMWCPERDFNKIKQLSLLSFMKRAHKLMITTHKGSQATNNNDNNSTREATTGNWPSDCAHPDDRRWRRRWWWPTRDEAAGTVASAKQLPNWLQLWIMSNGIIATNSRHKQCSFSYPNSLSLSLTSLLASFSSALLVVFGGERIKQEAINSMHCTRYNL